MLHFRPRIRPRTRPRTRPSLRPRIRLGFRPGLRSGFPVRRPSPRAVRLSLLAALLLVPGAADLAGAGARPAAALPPAGPGTARPFDGSAQSPDQVTGPASVGTPLALAHAAGAKPASTLVLTADALDAVVLRAYQQAAHSVSASDPHCGLTWPVLAGIGRIESDNGRDVPAGGGITADGTIAPPILGPALDGSAGFAAIRDGAAWARATGPMQFIPSTWAGWGADGNGDGRSDPNNIFDAALAAAHYLCAGGRSLADPVALAAAVDSYNHSDDYVRLVLQLIAAYAHEDPAALLTAAHLPTVTAAQPAARAATATPRSPGTGRTPPPPVRGPAPPASGPPVSPTAPSVPPTAPVVPTPPVAVPARFVETLQQTTAGLVAAGTDTGRGFGGLVLTQTWSFTLVAARPGVSPTLRLAATPAAVGWTAVTKQTVAGVTQATTTGVTTCAPGPLCTVATGPLVFTVGGGGVVTTAVHALAVSTTAGGTPATVTAQSPAPGPGLTVTLAAPAPPAPTPTPSPTPARTPGTAAALSTARQRRL